MSHATYSRLSLLIRDDARVCCFIDRLFVLCDNLIIVCTHVRTADIHFIKFAALRLANVSLLRIKMSSFASLVVRLFAMFDR